VDFDHCPDSVHRQSIALILYIVSLFVIGRASMAAVGQPPVVKDQWLNFLTGLNSVLAMNAGAYLGLPPQQRFRIKSLSDTDTIRFMATIIYGVALLIAFLISGGSQFPHPALTDMGATLIGVLLGGVTVALGAKDTGGDDHPS
jgi:hypothetical protein